MALKETLNILNGTVMYKHFKETHFLDSEIMIPFNEAMCWGEACEVIFSEEFNTMRAQVHHVTPALYADITLKPLQSLFRGEFNRIALWFDDDMFCQINLLTILAWLDQSDYRGRIDLNIVGDRFQPEDSYALKSAGFYSLYKEVVIHQSTPEKIHPPPLNKGIHLYLNYLKEDSDLMAYIHEHRNVSKKELVTDLIKTFRKYGLGDTQYAEIIESYRLRL
ncbi:AraC family transcriptional regulator [Lysinibacillus sphaericus]